MICQTVLSVRDANRFVSFVSSGAKSTNINKGGLMPCGCGRSPTGECIGWHALSEEEYQEKLAQWKVDHGEVEDSE